MTVGVSGAVELARWWWTFILRGVLAIAFGLLAFFAPPLGIGVLVGLFAAWAFIDGASNLVAGIQTRGGDRSWWLSILEGIVGIAAGVTALLFPVLAAEVLMVLVAYDYAAARSVPLVPPLIDALEAFEGRSLRA